MPRRLVGLTCDNLADLPTPCRSCSFWETTPVASAQVTGSRVVADKESWLSDTLLEWGSCGQLLYVDDVPAGYILYAPPAYVPRAGAFATAPVSSDAVLLAAARVVPDFRGGGLGRVLVQAAARDITRRGVRALEAFGAVRTRPHDESGGRARRTLGLSAPDCMLPADFLLAVGFKTVRAHPSAARLRLDVRNAVTWREDVEAVLDKLFGGAGRPVLSR